MVRREPLAERQAALSRVRFGQRSVRRGAQDDALPLPREGMPQPVLGQDRDRHGSVEPWLPDLGNRHLPCLTSLKSVSSMKLHRDLGITQKSVWHLSHRIRAAFNREGGLFGGPVEADETYVGGRRTNMSNAKRRELKDTGRGAVGKAAVVGVKDRETNEVRAVTCEAPTFRTSPISWQRTHKGRFQGLHGRSERLRRAGAVVRP